MGEKEGESERGERERERERERESRAVRLVLWLVAVLALSAALLLAGGGDTAVFAAGRLAGWVEGVYWFAWAVPDLQPNVGLWWCVAALSLPPPPLPHSLASSLYLRASLR
jgi:hypothetical protein